MKPEKVLVEYETGGVRKSLEGLVSGNEVDSAFGDSELQVRVKYSDGRFVLAVIPSRTLVLKNAVLYGSLETAQDKNTRYFLNGYQSWTDSREYSSSEKEKTVGYAPEGFKRKMGFNAYGDYDFFGKKLSKGHFHGWTYAYVRNKDSLEFAGSLSELTGSSNRRVFSDAKDSHAFALIKIDSMGNRFCIHADSDPLDYEISEQEVLLDLLFLKGTEEEVFSEYFQTSGIQKPAAFPVLGWTSWYDFYQNITEQKLTESLEGLRKTNAVLPEDSRFSVFQIDDGYEPFVGDWLSVDSEKFPEGLEPVVRKARGAGFKTGIWFAPFSAEKESALVKEHPDWLLCGKNGEPVLCGCNWSGFFGLDIYNEEVRDYVKKTTRHFIDDLGFTLLKIDFLYSACIVPRRDKTRGQVMLDAMEFFRQVSHGAELLGCGVPLGSAFGLVDYCRIGTDVSLSWDDKPYMRLLHRERPSTKNTILNSLYRRQLDGRAFLNDPDVFLLRSYNEKLGKMRKSLLSELNALAGSLVFTSDNPSTYDSWQKEELEKVNELRKAEIISVENKGSSVTVKFRYLHRENGERQLRFNRKNGKITEI